ncbi:hypothetical protein R6Q59_021238 [Mikania micrantha]
MGACFSFEYYKQHSFKENQGTTTGIARINLALRSIRETRKSGTNNADELDSSSTKEELKIPSEQSVSDSAEAKSSGSAVVISKDVKDLMQNPVYSNLDVFTYDEMRMTTKLFRQTEVLGEGGFGVVYKGTIDESVRSGYTKIEVAVKELNPEGIQGDTEWLTEVNYLGNLQHPNVVKLIGYCCEEDHRLLVYEYMASGSVERHLFRGGCNTLNWSRRMKIALHAAKGLAFLHNSERHIIFRDFKTSNILLDENFNAKLSDFGLAKDGPMGAKTHVSTRVRGTHGYAAPEYCMTGHLTISCDIYAFGVVLLELMTGLRSVDTRRPSGEVHLVDWIRPLLLLGKKSIMGVIDPRMEGQFTYKAALKVADLAYYVSGLTQNVDLSMSEAVETLESVQSMSRSKECEPSIS